MLPLKILFTIILGLTLAFAQNAGNYTPVVLWHGMGDTCCNPISLGSLIKTIEKEMPGVYVHSLKIGDSFISDMENSYFLQANKQIQIACQTIKNDPKLKNGYNAIGFSQGGQFLRAVVQTCPEPPMLNLVSLGGQHQGIFGLPSCNGLTSSTCDYLRKLLTYAAYTSWVQEFLVQASYWHDPLKENKYRKNSIFLADINNENVINQTYIKNLQSLRKLVLLKFEKDHMVQPKESEWFGYYKPGQDKELMTMEETPLYKEDRLGLKKMNDEGKIDFLSLPTDHLEFDTEWFINTIVNKYLK